MSKRETIRTYVRSAYDLQKIRIQMGNRLVALLKQRLGQYPGLTEDDLKDEAKTTLRLARQSYKRLADAMAQGKITTRNIEVLDGETDEGAQVETVEITTKRLKAFKGEDLLLTSMSEFCLMHQYLDIERAEAEHFKMMKVILKDYPIFVNFLEGVKGVGPAMAGVIISEIDIHQANTPASMWKYAGLDVVIVVDKEGATTTQGRGKYKAHLVQREYTNAKGEQAMRDSITFNPWLKTKLLGVLAGSFLKSKSPYAQMYYDYKGRLENHPAHKDKTAIHRHRMALRYMVKRFLVDLYKEWRSIEGLTIVEEYAVRKLGLVHHTSTSNVIDV